MSENPSLKACVPFVFFFVLLVYLAHVTIFGVCVS
jgi:hypothetical protein